MGEAIKKVEDLSIRSMQNKVKEWYEKFNDWRGWIKYSDELRFWCQQVIDQIDSKVNTWFSQLNGPKSKLSKDYRTKRDIFAKKSKNIRESIKRCCDSWTNVKRVHKDRLNNLAWKIDNYENAVVKMVNDLIDQQNEMQWVLKKEQATWKNYFDVKDGIYTLTKDTNLPKIHEVFDGVVKPWEKWMIDYSECKNATIKNRMLSTMWGYRCYLHCDKKKGTYFVSTSEIKPNENDGNKMMWISTQRALIREGVKIVPNSKITKDAKAAIEANAKKEANKWLTNDEKSDLKTTMPKKLREKLSEKPWLRDEFFTKTEYDLKNIILRAKSAGYKLTWEVCSRNWYTKNWRILEIHLIQWSTEVDWPLLTSKFSNPLFNRLDDREWDLVSYMKNRIKQLRGKLSYADKHETVIQWQRQTEKTTAKEIEDSKKLKENALYGLWLVWTLIDNLIEKKWNTWMTNDDQILSKCKTYVEDAIYSIENADIITKDNLTQIQNRLTDNIRPFYLNQLSFWISWLTKKEQVSKQLSNIISGPKAKAIKWVRKLWEWTTVFDNEETSFLRDEIIDNMDVKNATINETWANNCFKNIQKFLVWDDDIDRSKWEVKSGKKSLIDGLYSAAWDWTGEKLLKYMQDKGIMSKTVTFNNKKIKELSKNLASFLRRKEKNVKETLDWISTESVKQWLIQKKTQLEASNNLSEEQIRELNYYNYAIYEMPSDEFEEIVKEEKIKLSILRYQWVDDVLRSNLTPWLVKEGWWIKGINNEDILNDSLWTWWIFDRSDENCAKIWPIIKEIIEEVIITAVSILLSPTWAWEALYGSFRLAKAATKWLKWIAKLMKFLQKFAGAFAKLTARQFASKFSVRAAKSAKTVKNASRIVKWAEEVRWLKKIKYVCQTIKNTESLGSLCGKLAMKWTSLMIEWAAFHLNSTLIHNAIQGKRLGDWLNPFDYTEWPDGEKIPNRKSYAQSIAFLWILKTLGKSIQGVTWKWIEGISKWKYELNIAQKFLSNALSIGWEMWSMMVTDQILSIAFDHKFKEITGEDLIMMFGMIAWLRLNWKFEMKIQEYDKKSVTLEMKQWENTFNVKIDGQWNVLKVEWVDGSWRKFAHPEKELGIRSKVDWENLRATRAGQEVWTVEWNIRELWNLHEWDVITVKHGEKDVRLKKNDKWNWEIEDAWGIESDRFRPWEEFVVKENSDGLWYHLETKAWSWPKISLDWRVRVRLKGGESNWNRAPERWNTGWNEWWPKEPAPDMTQQRRQELLTKKNDLVKKKENHERRRSELENNKKTLENKKTDLLSQREANWRSLDGQKNNIWKINDILKQWNKITIDRLEYQFIGIKNWKAKFVIDKAAKKSAESRNLHFEETVEVSSLSELLDSRFNLEPWKKWTNSWRYDKLHELINDKFEPLDRLKNKIRNKTAEIKLLEQEIAGLETWNNTLAHNDFFEKNKQHLVWKKVWIDWVKYSAERINPDWTLQFKEVDGNKNFTISSFKQLAEKWDYINGFSDYLDANWRPQKQWRNMSNSEIQNDKLIKGLISWEAEYLSSRDIDQTLSEKRANLQVAQQELKWLQDKLPASQARQKKIDARAQRWKEINRDLRQVEQELDKVNADLWEADRLVKKYQDEIDQVDRDLSENDGVKEEPKKEDNNSEQNTWWERKENPKNNEWEVEQWIEKAEDVENEINKMLSDKTNTWNYKNLKLDWVTQKMFETWIFIEWVKNRFKNLKSGTSIPKQFLKNLRDKLVDMKTRFWTKLSEYHSKLVDSIKSAIDQKLAKVEAENIVKDIKKINLPIWNEYDLWNWEKIRLKKLENWKFVETEKFWWKTLDETFIEVHKWSEMTEWELVEFLKRKIVENMNKQPQYIEKQDRQRQIEAEAKAKAEADRQRQTEPKRQSNERPERWINTERREMSEVQRKSDVVAIWDLHGQYIALKWNMEFAWLAREVNWHLEWTGWNKKVVFQWDILADRWTDWLRIIEEIHNLREQARKEWWDIDIIVGNHDDFMIAYLTWRNIKTKNINEEIIWEPWVTELSDGTYNIDIWLLNASLNYQWRWLTELLDFVWIKRNRRMDDFHKLGENNMRSEILNEMKNSPEWKLILEEICNMKLVSQVDDVLYIHTNPTDAILDFLTSSGKWNVQKMINAINSKYQNYLRIMLLWEWNITSQQMKEFNGLSDLFLNTDNRITSQKLDYYQKLRNSWINMISHGHSWGSAIPENTVDLWDWKRHYLYEWNQANIWWVKIVDTDYSYGKKWWNEWQHSVSIVKKEWWVNYIWDNVAYANLEYPIWTEVYVKRSAWWESKAKVDSYNPTTKEYRVVWEEWWEIRNKDVTSKSLRKKDNNKSWKLNRDQQIEGEQRRQPQKNSEALNQGKTNIEILQEKLDLMCEWNVTVDNCKLNEVELNHVYNLFWKIKEITWKEKLNKREIKSIIRDEIGERELNNIINIKNKLKGIVWDVNIPLSKLKGFWIVEEIHINNIMKLKWKIEQLVWEIEISDIPDLINLTEWQIDNMILLKNEIIELVWKHNVTWNSLKYFTNINFLKNQNIRGKLKQLTWEIQPKDVQWLADISEWDLNIILGKYWKIKQITWKEKIKPAELNDWKNITEEELNNLISIKNEIWDLLKYDISWSDINNLKNVNVNSVLLLKDPDSRFKYQVQK